MYTSQTHITLANNFKRYMRIGTDCVGKSVTYTSKNCIGGAYADVASYASFFTNDGALLIFRNWTPKCTSTSNCGTIYIDINGRKGPDKLGRDKFLVWVYNDRLVPAGSQIDHFTF